MIYSVRRDRKKVVSIEFKNMNNVNNIALRRGSLEFILRKFWVDYNRAALE